MNLLEGVFHGVLDASVRASPAILILLGLRRWMRGRVPVGFLFWAWIAVALRLLWPVSLPVAWSPFNLLPWSQFFGYTTPPPELPPIGAIKVGAAVPPAEGTLLVDNPPAGASFSAGALAGLIWLTGAVALLLARIAACYRLSRLIRRSATPPDATATAQLRAAFDALGTPGVEVLVSRVVCAPALHGILRPRILFPPGVIDKLTAAQLRLTLAHELAHVRRRDLLADGFIHGAVIVHWFNPLAWLAARAAREECELACDEAVLAGAAPAVRQSYGATLLHVARLATGNPPPGFTLGVVNAKAQLKRRIQMITTHQSLPLSGTVLCGALLAAITGSSFTSELRAQIGADGISVRPAVETGPVIGTPEIIYNPSVDRLDALFPNGVVATVGSRDISVAEVREQISHQLPRLKADASSQDEFNRRLAIAQNNAVKDLVTRALLIQQFHDARDGQARQIPSAYVDTSIADEISERFGGDRSKFLAHLKERGLTQREYRKEIEERIIYNYMRGQERRLATTVGRDNSSEAARPIRLRIIQLKRTGGETDPELRERANGILGRVRNGESFELLARQFDQSGKREQGGDWGWQGAAELRPEFRDVVLALQKGETSAPILTSDSCFLFYADDRR